MKENDKREIIIDNTIYNTELSNVYNDQNNETNVNNISKDLEYNKNIYSEKAINQNEFNSNNIISNNNNITLPSKLEVKEPNEIDTNVISMDKNEIRRDFISKVYAIFLLQIITTAIISSIGFISSVKSYYQEVNKNSGDWILWLFFALTLVCIIPLICFKKMSKTVPYNYILLFSFTIFESLTLSYLYAIVDDWKIVLTAALMTVATTAGLTTYACLTKTDFTFLRGFLLVSIILLIFLGIFSLWFSFVRTLYCFLSVMLFSVYIIIDTQLILGKFNYEYSIDDYIIAALNIYVDVISLFSNLLSLLGGHNMY